MKRLCLFLSAGVLASCSKPPDSALAVRIRVAPSLKADCIELAISSGGAQRKSLLMPRTAMKDEWVVGVKRGDDLPETVTFQARAYVGSCDDAGSLKVNSRSAEVQATFPAKDVENVQPLQLDPPDATLDGDRDGYISSLEGGADCNDANPTTFPGGVQVCATEEDTDCDGAGACADSNCAASAECVDPPDRIKLLNVELQVQRLRCSNPITVQLENAVGARAAGVTTTVQLSASLQGLTFYSDASCTVPVTSVTIPFQQERTTVYLASVTAGASTLTATSGTLTPGTSDLVITPIPAASIAFTNQPLTITAGACANNVMTVELRDALGRPTTADTDLTVTLTSSPNESSGNFSTQADCSARSPNVSLPRGQGAATFRVYAETATTLMRVTAQVDVGTPPALVATQDVTVNADTPSKLAFRNSPLGYLASAPCSGSPLDIVVRDRFNNLAPSPTAVTLLLTGSAGITFHRQATCADAALSTVDMAAQATSVQVYVKGGAPGPNTVTVAAMSGSLMPATQTLSVSAGPPTRLTWNPNPRTTDSNICSPLPVTLVAFDSAGNPASFSADTPVAISQFSAATGMPVPGLNFYRAAGCGASSQLTGNATFPAGQTQVQLWFQGPTAVSAFTIRAGSAGGATGSDLPGNAIRPGPPSSLRFSTTSATTQAGQCAGPFTVTIRDAAGNDTSFAAATDLTFSAPQTPGVVTWGTAPGSCSGTTPISFAAGQTSTQVYFTSTTSRASGSPYVVTASAGGITSGSLPLNLQVGPAASTGLRVFEPMPTTQSLVAGSCIQVTVERKDVYGNDVPVTANASLTFPSSPPGVTVHTTLNNCQNDMVSVGSIAFTANVDARKTFYVRVETVLSAATFGMSLSVTPTAETASLTLTVTPGPAFSLSWNGLPTSRMSGVCSGPLTLTRRDRWGNDATADGALQAVITGSGVSYFPSGDCTGTPGTSGTVDFLANAATSSAVSVSSPTVGNYSLTATAMSMMTTQPFSVTAGMASKIVIPTPGATVRAGDCVNVTADILDANNNPAAGARTVTFSSSPDAVAFFTNMNCGTAGSSVNITGAQAQFSFIPSLPQAALVITAASTVPTALTSGQQTWAVQVGLPHHLAWKTPPPGSLARFTCSGAVVVELQDVANNPTPAIGDRTVTFNSTALGAGLSVFSDATCTTRVTSTTIPDGMTETTFYLAVTGNSMTNFNTLSTMPSMVQPTTPVAITPNGSGEVLTLATASNEFEAGGCVELTVARQTSTATPITLGTSTFTLAATPAGSVTFHATSACADPATPSFTIDHGASQTQVWARPRSLAGPWTPNNVSLTAQETYNGLGAASAMVNGYPLVRRGTCNFANNDATVRCVLSPAIPGNTKDRSFLVFTSSGDNTSGMAVDPTDSNVECHLDSTASDVAVACSRGNNREAVSVNYQVVSWGRDYASGGVSVRHLTGTFAASATTQAVILSPAIPNIANAFLLFSTSSASGTTNNEDDFPTAVLTAGAVNLTRLDAAGAALGYSVQVVEFAGATVDRGAVTAQTAAPSITIGSLAPVTTNRTFLLFTARTDTGTPNNQYICKRRLKGRFASTTSLSFRRGASMTPATNCTDSIVQELAWERVQLPTCSVACPAVQHLNDVTLTNNTNANSTMFTAIAQHKSIVFFAGQGAGGQSAGETNYANADAATGDNTGVVHGVATFQSDTQVRIDRALGGTMNTAIFAPQVVQFDP
ncbi:MAG: hypothetical protein AB1938_25310 [Myxococcota bacterium]